MTLTRRGAAKRRHDHRKAWLEPVLATYQRVPGLHDDVTNQNRDALEALCRRMDEAGLFGTSATPEHRSEIVRRLLSELRGEDVGTGW